MKSYSLFFIFILLFIGNENAKSQSVNFTWGNSIGNTANDYGYSIAIDNSGFIYISGAFQSSSITFGTLTLNNTSLAGYTDAFLAKLDSNGNVLWAKNTSGTYDETSSSVTTDNNANVYVTGYRTQSCSFETDTLLGAGMFIVKYDSSGNVLWANGTEGGYGTAVTTDDSDNVIITGYYPEDTIVFDTYVLPNKHSGRYEIFIAKYDINGSVIWAKSISGDSHDVSYGITSDHVGNIYLTGDYNSDTLFFGTAFITLAGTSDVFIAKFNLAGNVIWVKSAGGTGTESGRGIASDNLNNLYVAGNYSSNSISFDSITLTNTGSFADIFTAKYDSAGNILWVKTAGGTTGDMPYNIHVDDNGNIVEIGVFESSMITFATTPIYNQGSLDIFILSYDSAGNERWLLGAGADYDDVGYGISTDGTGNTFAVGCYMDTTVNLGPILLTNALPGWRDVLVTKISSTTSQANEFEINEGLLFYPNPASNQVSIGSNNQEINNIDFYNMFGEKILATVPLNSNSKLQTFDISMFPNGIYFVIIKSGYFSSTKKLIIAR